MILRPAERRLLVKLAHGKTVREAAAEVGIKEQSAKNRLSFAYARLGVEGKYGAFLELGWLTPPEDDE